MPKLIKKVATELIDTVLRILYKGNKDEML